MPTAKKLPSGSYRCQVFAGYEFVDGKKKRKYESFTAPTKREAEAMAAKWATSKKARPEDITVKEAVEKFMESRRPILSPSTIRGYKSCVARFATINDIPIRKLKQSDVQLWVSGLAVDLSPKTVRNTYNFFTGVINFIAPDMTFNIKLPAKIKKDYYIPPDEDITKLLAVCSPELWCAVMLARYYSLRRGEICALRSTDLEGNILTIRRVIVQNEADEWEIKERPKTDDSYRYLVISDPLLSVLKTFDGQIISCNPDNLLHRFRWALKKAKIKPFNFHILRHMFATNAAKIWIPDFYTAKMGGWNQNSGVLKTIYQNVRDEDLREQMDILNKSMQHDMQHETPPKSKNP